MLRVTGTGAGTTLVALQVSWHGNLPALSPRPRLRQESTSRSRSSPGAAGRCPGLAVPEDLQGHPEAGVAKLLQNALLRAGEWLVWGEGAAALPAQGDPTGGGIPPSHPWDAYEFSEGQKRVHSQYIYGCAGNTPCNISVKHSECVWGGRGSWYQVLFHLRQMRWKERSCQAVNFSYTSASLGVDFCLHCDHMGQVAPECSSSS